MMMLEEIKMYVSFATGPCSQSDNFRLVYDSPRLMKTAFQNFSKLVVLFHTDRVRVFKIL